MPNSKNCVYNVFVQAEILNPQTGARTSLRRHDSGDIAFGWRLTLEEFQHVLDHLRAHGFTTPSQGKTIEHINQSISEGEWW